MNRYLIIFSMLIFGCSNVSNNNIITMNKIKNVSLKDKIAQMIMVRADGKYYHESNWKEENLNNLINKHNIGGLITYSGSVHGTYYKLESYQKLSKIPLFIAADYERGLGTFMDGTLFPPNMAVSATNIPDYAYEQGRMIAEEAKKIGVHIILAPVLDINNNLKNPIINIRSYGDNPETVVKYGIPFLKGVQDAGLIACAKHYPGHGNTSTDSHTSLPTIDISEEELFNNELVPFKKACDAGVQSIMVGHILIPALDEKLPATFSKIITEDVIRNQWNYNGLIITDALEMGALTNTTWHGESAIRSIEGGADIILLPLDAIGAIDAIFQAVESGRIPEDRINYSYEKIINKKNEIGLINRNNNNWNELNKIIANSNHLKIAGKIAEKSITVVKNEKSLLPFIPNKYKKVTHIFLSTDNDLRTRMKSFAYNVKYTHGNVNEIYVNDPLSDLAIRDIINKTKNSDVIIISMLIRISMNKGLATIHFTHQKLLNELKSNDDVPMLGISFGSPYLPNYNVFDSYICAYGYGKVSFDATFEGMFGRKDMTGKLPVTLNDNYKIGHGVEVKKNEKIFIDRKIDLEIPLKIINNAISDSIFPGAQIFVSKGDEILINKGIGHYTYDEKSKKVSIESIYDVASLTKVLATTPVIMKLVQQKKIGLDYPLYHFYPELEHDLNKQNLTISHLLTHTSGFKPHEKYYEKEGFDSKNAIIKDILAQDLIYKPDQRTVYSDLGIILLLDIIEKITGSKIDKLSEKYFYSPLDMSNTFFNPDVSVKDNIVPTEDDDYFRNRLIQGEVHDENTFILDGVSTHAGLFSNAYDIGIFSKMLLNEGVHLGRRYLKKDIIKKFTKRVNTPNGSDRTIGWDTPSQDGKSSAGDYFSNKSFGHLGFTGTSLWIDPQKEIIVVLLTNRIHPKRGNKKEMYAFRREFHNSLMKIIGD